MTLGAENAGVGRAAGLACPAKQAPCVLQRVLPDTGEPTAPSPASVTTAEPATPRMGAVFAPQAGPDTSAWKVPTEGKLHASVPKSALAQGGDCSVLATSHPCLPPWLSPRLFSRDVRCQLLPTMPVWFREEVPPGNRGLRVSPRAQWCPLQYW